MKVKTNNGGVGMAMKSCYMPKRRNKRKSPMKMEMIMWIRDYRNVRYAMDTPYNTIKKYLQKWVEMSGGKTKQIKSRDRRNNG